MLTLGRIKLRFDCGERRSRAVHDKKHDVRGRDATYAENFHLLLPPLLPLLARDRFETSETRPNKLHLTVRSLLAGREGGGERGIATAARRKNISIRQRV